MATTNRSANSSEAVEASHGSQPSSLTLPFSSTLNPLALKLDRHNYNFWQSQVLLAVHVHGLEDFILGTKLCPEQYVPTHISPSSTEVIDKINPHYINWTRLDQFLVSWLLSSIFESVYGHIV